MKNRSQRLLTIRKLVDTYKITSQNELLEKIQNSGFKITQATLSRDLQVLKAYRIYDPGGKPVYVISGKEKVSGNQDEGFAKSGFKAFIYANNMGLVKTNAGYASGIASIIDQAGYYEIAGTIAGDDTILIIPSDGTNLAHLKHILGLIFPELIDRIR